MVSMENDDVDNSTDEVSMDDGDVSVAVSSVDRQSESPNPGELSPTGWDDQQGRDWNMHFPSGAAGAIYRQLTSTSNSFVVADLLHVLQAASMHPWMLEDALRSDIMKTSSENIRQFVRDSLGPCLDRLWKEDGLSRLTLGDVDLTFQAMVYYFIFTVQSVRRLSSLMEHGGVPDEEALHMFDVSTLTWYTCMALDTTCPLYKGVFCSVLPPSVESLEVQLVHERLLSDVDLDHMATADAAGGSLVVPDMQELTAVGIMQPCTNVWLPYFRRLLQSLHLATAVAEVCQEPRQIGLFTYEHLIKSVELAYPDSKLAVEAGMPVAVANVLLCLQDLVLKNPDSICSGRDRFLSPFSGIIRSCHALLSHMGQPTDMVSEVQRVYIQENLKSSHFTRTLSAVRECSALLTMNAGTADDGAAYVATVKWMHMESIVKQILRTNLHVRQYAEAVLDVLRLLTQNDALQEDDLDMLWDMAEQEGTFEMVKTNVYFIVEELASRLTPSRLGHLFTRFEASSKGRALADTMRLLELLRKLATLDSVARKAEPMADKLLDMIWHLTMPVDAPPELAQSNVISEVLREYTRGSRILGPQAAQLRNTYLERCVARIAARQDSLPALLVLRNLLLVHQPTVQDKSLQTQQSLGQWLDGGRVLQLVVDNLVDFMQSAARWVAERAPAPGAAPPRPPGQGCYSYPQVVEEHFKVIKQVVRLLGCPRDLAERLWDVAVLNHVTEEDLQQALRFFQAAGSEFLDPDTLRHLLVTRATQLPPASLSLVAFNTFRTIFDRVNENSGYMKILRPGQQDTSSRLQRRPTSLQLTGLPYLWSVALDVTRTEVFHTATETLLHLYNHPVLPADQSKFTAAFVRECTRHLVESTAMLAGVQADSCDWSTVQLYAPGSEGGVNAAVWECAKRRVFRCLYMMSHMLTWNQGTSMPPIPCHGAAARHPPLQLDVQLNTRIKLTTHAHEYVGLIRRRIAHQLDLEPQFVRLICSGKEWTDDAQMVGPLIVSDRARQLLFVPQRGAANSYSHHGAEHLRTWSEGSMTACVAHMEDIYHVLLLLADIPGDSAVREAASQTLQQLPTVSRVPRALRAALDHPQPAQQLQQLFFGHDGRGQRPAQLLYTLQALHALLFPSYPPELRFELPPSRLARAGSLQASLQDVTADAAGNAYLPVHGDVSLLGTSEQAAPNAVALADVQPWDPQSGVMVVASCLPLLEQVVDWAMHAGKQDINYLRELHTTVVVLLGNIYDWAAAARDVAVSSSSMLEDVTAQVITSDLRPAAIVIPASPSSSPMAQSTPSMLGPSTHPASPSMMDASTPGGATAAMEADTAEVTTEGRLLPASATAAVQSPAAMTPAQATVASTLAAGLASADGTVQVVRVGGSCGKERTSIQADAPAGGKSATAQHSSQLLTLSTLQLLLSFLVRLAWDAARLWGLANPPLSQGSSVESSPDVMLVREAMATLTRALKAQPELLDAVLDDPRCGPMLEESLLSVHYSAVRSTAAEAIARICLGPAAPRGTALWLLARLAAMRCRAAKCPGASAEFYRLFVQVLQHLGTSPCPASICSAALLAQEEVASLSDVAALVAADNSLLLDGKLQLLLALARFLDGGAPGVRGARQGLELWPGLLELLIRRYLFPEAEHCGIRKDVPVSELWTALHGCIKEDTVRRTALGLLSDLMTSSSAALEQGTDLLCRLHYDTRMVSLADRKFDYAGDVLRQPGGYMGLRNGGATCYMNAVLQQLFMQPRIRELVLAAKSVDVAERSDSVFAQLQSLFATLLIGNAGSYNPRHFWHSFKDYDGNPVDIKEHQDAYEFFTRLQDFIDQHLRCTNQQPAMQQAMGGRFAQQLICKDVPHRSEREEEFYQLSVDVKGQGSLDKSLESYVAGELMEGDNAYYCEEIGRRVSALKRTVIKELPQTLVIHLKRFEYDHFNMTRFKVRERFEFPLSLDMFKYTADGLAAMEASALQVATDLQPGKPRNHYLYELKGVVVHSGTAFAGHYYSHIKERPKLGADGQLRDGKWYVFDDRSVQPWDVGNLEQDCYGGRCSQDGPGRSNSLGGQARPNDSDRPYSAYMLFYERKDAACYDDSALKMQLPPAQGPVQGLAAGQAAILQQQRAQQQQQQVHQQQLQAPLDGSDTPSAFGVATADNACPMLISPRPELSSATTPAFIPHPDLLAAVAAQGHVPQRCAAAMENGAVSQSAADSSASPRHDSSPQPTAPTISNNPLPTVNAAALAAVPPATAASPLTPYGMSVQLFEGVLRENLKLVHKLHMFHPDYFRFVRSVVEAKWEGRMGFHKTRRRDTPSRHSPGPSFTAAGGMDSVEGGGGNSSPSVANVGGNAASGTAAGSMEVEADGISGVGSGSSNSMATAPNVAVAAANSAPSQRNEEQEGVLQILGRLTTAFLLSTYIPAPPTLRSDWATWLDLISHQHRRSARTIIYLFEMLCAHPEWLRIYLNPNMQVDVAEVLPTLLYSGLTILAQHHELFQIVALPGFSAPPQHPHAQLFGTRMPIEWQNELQRFSQRLLDAVWDSIMPTPRPITTDLQRIFKLLHRQWTLDPRTVTNICYEWKSRLPQVVVDLITYANKNEDGDFFEELLAFAQAIALLVQWTALANPTMTSSATNPSQSVPPAYLHPLQPLPPALISSPYALNLAFETKLLPRLDGVATDLAQLLPTLLTVDLTILTEPQLTSLSVCGCWNDKTNTLALLQSLDVALVQTNDEELETCIEAVLRILTAQDMFYPSRMSHFLTGVREGRPLPRGRGIGPPTGALDTALALRCTWRRRVLVLWLAGRCFESNDEVADAVYKYVAPHYGVLTQALRTVKDGAAMHCTRGGVRNQPLWIKAEQAVQAWIPMLQDIESIDAGSPTA